MEIKDQEKMPQLLSTLEENYKRGCKLADELKKTADLHQKMMDVLNSFIKKLIDEGQYEKAEHRLEATRLLLEELEFRSISSHIQDKLMGIVEGKLEIQ